MITILRAKSVDEVKNEVVSLHPEYDGIILSEAQVEAMKQSHKEKTGYTLDLVTLDMGKK